MRPRASCTQRSRRRGKGQSSSGAQRCPGCKTRTRCTTRTTTCEVRGFSGVGAQKTLVVFIVLSPRQTRNKMGAAREPRFVQNSGSPMANSGYRLLLGALQLHFRILDEQEAAREVHKAAEAAALHFAQQHAPLGKRRPNLLIGPRSRTRRRFRKWRWCRRRETESTCTQSRCAVREGSHFDRVSHSRTRRPHRLQQQVRRGPPRKPQV
jgi:hypothetical protein